jgi:hypothetical protein
MDDAMSAINKPAILKIITGLMKIGVMMFLS